MVDDRLTVPGNKTVYNNNIATDPAVQTICGSSSNHSSVAVTDQHNVRNIFEQDEIHNVLDMHG
ncbi:hypothetical protein D3C81_2323540 [compost metagenome]